MTDAKQQQTSTGGGGGSRLLRPLAIGAGVAGAVIAGRALLARRHGDDGSDEGSKAGSAAAEAGDLATELRGAASDIAVSLLDRATTRLERD